MIVDRRGIARRSTRARRAPARELRLATRDRGRRCAGRSPPARGTRRRSARTCSTSRCRSRRAASSEAPCASPTRRPTVDARDPPLLARPRGDRRRSCSPSPRSSACGSPRFVTRPLARARARRRARSAAATSTRARREQRRARPRCGRSRPSSTTRSRSSSSSSGRRTSSSPTPRTSCGRRSRRCGCGSRTSRATSTPAGERARRRAGRGRAARAASSTACSRSRAPMQARRPPERVDLGDARARARRRVDGARGGARRAPRRRRRRDGVRRARPRRSVLARCSTTCSRTRSRPRRAGGDVTVGGRAPHRHGSSCTSRDEGPGMIAEERGARSTASGAPGAARAVGPRVWRSSAGSSRPTAARSSSEAPADGLEAVVRLRPA